MRINIQTLGDACAHGDLNELQKNVLLNEIQYMKSHHMRKISAKQLENWLFEGSINSSENFNIQNDVDNAQKIMEEIKKYEK